MAKQLVDELKDGVKKRLEEEKEKLQDAATALSPSEIAKDVKKIIGEHELTAEEIGVAVGVTAAGRADGMIDKSEFEVVEKISRKEK